MPATTPSIYQSIWIPLRLVLLMILFFVVQTYLQVELRFLAYLPRTLEGLVGIIFSPLVHVNSFHLLSNIFPLLCLGTVVYWFYGNIATRVFLRCYFVPQVLVWIFARPHAHVGADPKHVLEPNTRIQARFSILHPVDIVFDGKALKVA